MHIEGQSPADVPSLQRGKLRLDHLHGRQLRRWLFRWDPLLGLAYSRDSDARFEGRYKKKTLLWRRMTPSRAEVKVMVERIV